MNQRTLLRPSGKLLAEDTRRHHRALLLQHLFREGAASRADLARSTGLTRVTVGELVGELMGEGLLVELGAPRETRVGKPPILIGLATDALQILTVDLSVDHRMSGAVVDLAGEVRARCEVRRDAELGDDAVTLLHRLVADLVAAADRPLLGIGVGTPGVVGEAGVVADAPNLGWRDLALAAGLDEAFDLPTYVANDANTAVLGEHTFGRAGDGGLMLLRIGTGLGAGLILEGAMLHGHQGAAGEIGHVVVDPDGVTCACGRRGCLETLVAVPRLREIAAGADPEAGLADAGVRLGAALAPVVGTLDLGELVLSGPADLLEGPLLTAVEQTIGERTMPVGEPRVVRTTSLGEDVVLLGAAVLVLTGQLGVS